jgi:hypothetical protein
MPIDAAIPLSGRPVQAPDVVDTYGKMLSLQNLKMQQAEMQRRAEMEPVLRQQHEAAAKTAQAQATMAGIQAQQVQQDQKDDQIWADSISEKQGKVPDAFTLAVQKGLSTRGQARTTANMNAALSAAEDLKKKRLGNDEEARIAENKRHTDLMPHLEAFANKPEEEQERDFDNWLSSNRNAGHITDQEFAQLQQMFPPSQEEKGKKLFGYPGKPGIDALREKYNTSEWINQELTQREKQAKLDADNAKLAAERATTAKTNAANAEQKRVTTLSKLAAATTPDAFAKIQAGSGLGSEEIGGDASQYFDKDGHPIASQMKSLRNMALNPKDHATADAAAERADQTRRKNETDAQYKARMAAAAETRAAKMGTGSTARSEASAVRSKAERLIASNGKDVDKAMADYQESGSDDPDYGDVLRELRGIKRSKTTEDKAEADLDKKTALSGLDEAKAKNAWQKANPNQPFPAAKALKDWWQKNQPGAAAASGTRPPAPAPTPAPAPKPTPAPAPAPTPAPTPTPKKDTQATAPKIPEAAKAVHDALRKANVPFTMVDGSDGLPILEKGGKQYKVRGIKKDGSLDYEPGVWK